MPTSTMTASSTRSKPLLPLTRAFVSAIWRFNNSSFPGEAGQQPFVLSSVTATSSWSGYAALFVTNTGSGSLLTYRESEPSGTNNINCKNGTVRWWFRPAWDSASLGGTGPNNDPRLLEVGKFSYG